MARMSGPDLKEEEVQITFTRSVTGKKKTIPVWFTVNEGKMELLPMHGRKSKWFIDVEKSGKAALKVKGWEMEAKPKVVTAQPLLDEMKRRFAYKYGEGKVRKYYPTPDAAFEVPL